VGRPHHVEVAPVGGRDLSDLQTFRGGYHRGVDRAEGKVAVASHQLGDPHQIPRMNGFKHEVAARDVPQEPDLGLPAEPGAEQVGDLRDH
jgi:hypothetical protein